MTTAQLNREAFRAWLAAREPDAVVGVSDTWFSCPLAQWLDPVRAMVDGECFYVGGKPYALPDWARDFTHTVDLIGGPITAAEALLALTAGEDRHEEWR